MHSPASFSQDDAALPHPQVIMPHTDPEEELEYLAYVISHDLQTSVRHVGSFSHLLAEAAQQAIPDQPRLVELANTLTEVSDTLETRVHAVLTYSRIGRRHLQWVPIDLRDLLDAVRSTQQAQIEAQQPQLLTRLEVDTWPGDFHLLWQLLSILLDNALRFTRLTGQPEIRLTLTRSADERLSIRCTDNGVGFDPRRQRRLFRLFSVLHSRTEYSHVGLGTGLAMARRIVQRLGGTMVAEGQPGQGATFAVHLPYHCPVRHSQLPEELQYLR